jgi:hypothetical protein
LLLGDKMIEDTKPTEPIPGDVQDEPLPPPNPDTDPVEAGEVAPPHEELEPPEADVEFSDADFGIDVDEFRIQDSAYDFQAMEAFQDVGFPTPPDDPVSSTEQMEADPPEPWTRPELLPDEAGGGGGGYSGEWYWFYVTTASNPIYAGGTRRLFAIRDFWYFYPEFDVAGKITAARASCTHALTDGSITIYPAKGSQTDTRADGAVDTWTDGTDSLVLSAGVSSNRATGWTQLSIAAGESLGCKAVGDADLDPIDYIGLVVGLYFTPD